jgi:hypothetical protein
LVSVNGDESDNVVLRHLRDLRTGMKAGFDDLRSELDVGLVKVGARLSDVEGLARTTLTEIVALSRRVEHIETGLRVAERLAAVEEKLAQLERRLPPG